jgi:hypothetical protein
MSGNDHDGQASKPKLSPSSPLQRGPAPNGRNADGERVIDKVKSGALGELARKLGDIWGKPFPMFRRDD